MIACDTQVIAALSLGSGPLIGMAMFSTAQVTNTRHSIRTEGATGAASKVRSQSTAKSSY